MNKRLFLYILRDLPKHVQSWIFPLLCLTTGLVGIFFILNLNSELQTMIRQKSSALLGGDLRIKSIRKFTVEEERKVEALIDGRNIEYNKELVFLSMVTFQESTRLNQIHFVDENFPLVKTLRFEDGRTDHTLIDSSEVWIEENLANLMQIHIGQTIKFLDSSARVSHIIAKDASMIGNFFAFAPNIYLSRKHPAFAKSNDFGTRLTDSYLFKLTNQGDILKLENDLKAINTDSFFQITNAKDYTERTSRDFSTITDYLGIIMIIGLILLAVALVFLSLREAQKRMAWQGILTVLGVSRYYISAVYLLERSLLYLTATFCAVGAHFVAYKFALSYLAKNFDLILSPTSDYRLMVMVSVVGLFAFLLLSGVLFYDGTKPIRSYFDDSVRSNFSYKRLIQIFSFLIFAAVVFIYSFSRSLEQTEIFIGLLSGLFLVFFACAYVIRYFILKIRKNNWIGFWLLQSEIRNRSVNYFAMSVVAAISLTLILTLGKVQYLIGEQFASKTQDRAQIFLFDIIPDQKDKLILELNTLKITVDQWAPLVRGRLLEVDGNKQNQNNSIKGAGSPTREQDEEESLRNRYQNLTYRGQLGRTEKFLSGVQEFAYDPQKPDDIPVSLEQRFAKKTGMHIGSTMIFDIQGVQLKTRVVQIRSVRWTSFQPGFFVAFPPGVLEDAPQILIATIKNLSPDQIILLEKTLGQKFQNISFVDVGQTADKILKVLNQFFSALVTMSYFVLGSGILLLMTLFLIQWPDMKKTFDLTFRLGLPKSSRIQFLGLTVLTYLSIAVLLSLSFSKLVAQILYTQLFT